MMIPAFKLSLAWQDLGYFSNLKFISAKILVNDGPCFQI